MQNDRVHVRRRDDGSAYLVPVGSVQSDPRWEPEIGVQATPPARCVVRMTHEELREALGLPETAQILDVRWDFDRDYYELKLQHPDAPPTSEGEALHRVPLDYFS